MFRMMLFVVAATLLTVVGSAAAAVCDVTAHGAAPDGKTLNTAAIQAAIDECAGQGGGEVVFPAGSYLTGTIYLKNHVHLRFLPGATLLGSTDLGHYPVNICKYPSWSDYYTVRALIWGEGLEDVGISGPGVLDGQGAAFRGKEATPDDIAAVAPAFEREGRFVPRDVYLNRPYLIRMISCRNVLIENVTMRNSAMWMQHYLDCDFLTLRGVNVYNHVSSNNDMVDVDGCRNVLISDCVGDSDDDALTLKSTGARPTEHVVITNCILRSHCNAIKAGTESAGGFKDITISNCVIQRSAETKAMSARPEGLGGISLELVDGGSLERISISNIVVEGTTAPIFMRLGNRARTTTAQAEKPGVGVFRDVSISNVTATGASRTGCVISGIPGHPIENIALSNIRIRFNGGGTAEEAKVAVPEEEAKYPEPTMFGILPAYGFYFRHVKGLRLDDIELGYDSPDLRPAVVTEDVHDLRLGGFKAMSEPSAMAQIVLRNTQNALLSECVAAKAEAFLAVEAGCAEIRILNSDLTHATRTVTRDDSVAPETVTEAFNLPRPK